MTDAATEARTAADRAAAAAGVRLRPADDLPTQRAVVELLAAVWRTDRDTIVPLPLLRAMDHAGNYTVAVERGSELIGGGFAYAALADGHTHLHSHIVGFAPRYRGRGCGYATKLDQRAWALERGIGTITWTYDPLVRTNAGFNLVKLGAVVETYLPNFYGEMADGVNAADESDRMLVTWRLGDPGVRDAVAGQSVAPDRDDLLAAGAAVLLDVDADGSPEARPVGDADVLLVATPTDVVALRSSDREAARAWRHCVRDTLGAAIRDGWVATDVTADGWYVLRSSTGQAA